MQQLEVVNASPGTGPNPWKVIIVLEELELPYKITWISYADIKSEPFVSLNPNGRVPAFKDPNTGVVMFESGAIIEYIIEIYDKNHKISYGGDQLQEKWLCRSWLHFQMSGQGPMFGQKMWFTHFHQVKDITSALERYGNETKRIVGVIEMQLAKQQKEVKDDGHSVWLIGNKCTFADLAFITWNVLLLKALFSDGFNAEADFPLFYQWHARLLNRPAVEKALEHREHCIATMEDTARAVLPKERRSEGEK